MSPPAAAKAAGPTVRPAASAVRASAFGQDHPDDLLRLDLRDVPYLSPGLHVEALQPSLFTRFFGLFMR